MESGIVKGNLNHCFAYWPYASIWTPTEAISVAKELGAKGIELFPEENWAELKAAGLQMPMALVSYGADGPAPFAIGWGNPEHREKVAAETRRLIDRCAEFGFPKVIAFTGYGEANDASRQCCVEGLQSIAPYAQSKGVTLCLEHLTSLDLGHPMKGHPGYMGDQLPWVASIVREVKSNSVRLLFDLYHVQNMHPGEVMNLFAENLIQAVGHVHVAQCPGRTELDMQGGEIDFPEAAAFLKRFGYKGWLGQEFVPAEGRDPRDGLAASLSLCDA